MRLVVLAAIAGTACYHPSIESCKFRCANDNNDSTSCPSGLTCEAASSMCVASGDSCLLTGDAPMIDAPLADAHPGCTLMAPNVKPCDVFADSVTGAWHVSEMTTIDTGDQLANTAVVITGSQPTGNATVYRLVEVNAGVNSGVQAAVVVMSDFNVTAKLLVIGKRPLIILAQTATVTGTITATNNAVCAGDGDGKDGMGALGASGAGGGGGGGNGMPGAGDGGAGFSATGGTAPATAGVPSGHNTNEPLLSGCVGGAGGGPSGAATTKAAGGAGGGAIQITAFMTLAVHGTIDVSGKGGRTGMPANLGSTGGGGGGGAGGSILLDSPALDLSSGALCGNGGGGGGVTVGGNGADATCSTTPAAGGDGGTSGSGAANTSPATTGADGTSLTVDGGGGGGGCGIIHFTHTPTQAASLVTPPEI